MPYVQAIYNTDALGYPTKGGQAADGRPTGSANFSLHRAVQSVMIRPEFKGDLEVTEAHVEAVAKCVPSTAHGRLPPPPPHWSLSVRPLPHTPDL